MRKVGEFSEKHSQKGRNDVLRTDAMVSGFILKIHKIIRPRFILTFSK